MLADVIFSNIKSEFPMAQIKTRRLVRFKLEKH